MNTRPSNAQIPIHYFINSNINSDVLFHIMVRLDIQHIILLWFAAKYSDKYWEKMDGIHSVLSNNSFWKKHAKYHLKSNQLSDVSNYQKVMLDRHFSHSTLKNHLGKSEYFSQGILGGFTGIYSGFDDGIMDFTISDIETYLLNDDVENLFNKIINLPGLLDLVNSDNQDAKIIQRYKVENNVQGKHLGFLGLLPCIINMRAVNCFDLFMRAYFTLLDSGNPIQCFGEINPEKYSFLNIMSFVMQCDDVYFIKQFIHLVIKCRQGLKVGVFKCIQYAIDAKYYDLLRDAFQCIGEDKFNEILNVCENQFISKQLLLDIRLGYKYKTNLKELLNEACTVDDNEKHLERNIDKLLKLRSQIDLCLTQWIQDLHEVSVEKRNMNRAIALEFS